MGSFCSNKGCTNCEPCDEGQESLTEGSIRCSKCLPGFHKEKKGLDNCVECEIGSYSVFAGAKFCSICPEGYFCPCASCPPRPCPKRAICPMGSIEYIICSSPFFYVGNISDKKCSKSAFFYITIFGSISIFLGLLLFGIFKYQQRSKRDKNLTQKLMSETKDPLYYGY